jgi:Protein of unknown function (DUF1573)
MFDVSRITAVRRPRPARFTWPALVVALGLVAFGCADPGRKASSPATEAPPPSPPRVTVDPEFHDLGVVGFGEQAVAEFVVRNEGGSPLTLAVPQTPRGIAVDGLGAPVPPGQSLRLRVNVDTFEANAERQQAVNVTTNDPERPTVTLVARIDVRPFLIARPGYARYITVQHAREGTITQTIGATDGAEFRILRVESPTPNLRVSFWEATPEQRDPSWPGSQWRVATTLDSVSPVGPLSGLVVVHTDHPRQKRIFIQLSGFVRPVLAATPPEVRMGDVGRQRAEPWRIFVRNFAEETIEVTEVSTDVAAVRAELEPLQPGRSWRVNLFPVAEAPLGPFEGKVLLRTASPTLPTFEIPVAGRLVDSVSN